MSAVAVKEPVVIDIHPLGKIFLMLNLYIRMNQRPFVLPVFKPPPDKPVNIFSSDFRVSGDLPEFFVQN